MFIKKIKDKKLGTIHFNFRVPIDIYTHIIKQSQKRKCDKSQVVIEMLRKQIEKDSKIISWIEKKMKEDIDSK